MLEIHHLRFDYPEAIIRAHFTLAAGGSAALMGSSGAGKSTVLNLIAGFLQPHSGEVRFGGRSLLSLKPAERPLTYLLQAHNLFPHLSARHNIAIGLHPGLRLSAAQKAVIDEALEWVALTKFAHRKPYSLSGGQQQRVALARCMARCMSGERPLLLLDEPFNGLDEALRADILALILALQKSHALTVLTATHQQRDADALGAEVVAV